MDCYYDCPCGHAHHEHNWHHREGLSACLADGCDCWTYHGHRLGGTPHIVVANGSVEPTLEMRGEGFPCRCDDSEWGAWNAAEDCPTHGVVGQRAATTEQEHTR